ncbi:hypothetical protein EUX98_g818 [Antrodiella citrinella]|uniref:Yeast cell wall synthesis Kre9/Knh1-like N-terminal domain-containing protein n=1 Tax=Antrodiella citrinella TaxID=2447956 RepID=A0A4S4N332_9APHY|nr:hypothetical protein EUX98_g818 [Antrodiella citrinella]
MRFAAFVAALLPTVALATISITGPSETEYWVQFTSNNISWSFAAGDPNPVSIIIQNGNASFLNGAFSIAQNIDVSLESFTVTNVTLNVDDGFQVAFVNPSNQSQIYATSSNFSVKAPGTAPAPPINATASASSSSSSPSATSPTSSGAASPTGNAASHSGATTVSAGVMGAIVAGGIAAFSALLV